LAQGSTVPQGTAPRHCGGCPTLRRLSCTVGTPEPWGRRQAEARGSEACGQDPRAARSSMRSQSPSEPVESPRPPTKALPRASIRSAGGPKSHPGRAGSLPIRPSLCAVTVPIFVADPGDRPPNLSRHHRRSQPSAPFSTWKSLTPLECPLDPSAFHVEHLFTVSLLFFVPPPFTRFPSKIPAPPSAILAPRSSALDSPPFRPLSPRGRARSHVGIRSPKLFVAILRAKTQPGST